MSADRANPSRYYRNPVYNRSFPDPFVLRWAGQYYAYGTGLADDGRVFPVLTSDDLVNWTYAGGAMSRLVPDHPHYWAPETSYRNGLFYLYFSVGNETEMEIRVAGSDRPSGGFEDLGVRLTGETFAIDAHVFRDTDGVDYLFYATDYLEHSHIGTGTAVDRMISPTQLAGSPRPVSRAKFDWQVYHPNRPEKGFVRWHTVEGPAVFKRKGKYFQMFSGGNWQNESYGVSYAVSDDLSGSDEWQQVSDGVTMFPILRSIEGRILGPGHNSIALGPNGREMFCIYHEWIDGERVLAIDRMDVVGDRIFLIGPTDTPQPMPYKPRKIEQAATLDAGGRFEWDIPSDTLFETYFMCPNGNVLLSLFDGSKSIFSTVVVSEGSADGAPELRHLRMELMHRQVTIEINGAERIHSELSLPARSLRLSSEQGGAEFRALSLTLGFEELFVREDLATRGWRASNADVAGGRLLLNASAGPASLSRDISAEHFEVCFNLGRPGPDERIFRFGAGPELHLKSIGSAWHVNHDSSGASASFDHESCDWRQLRLVVRNGDFEFSMEGEFLLSGQCEQARELSINVSRGQVLLEMIRYTEINADDL